MTTNRILIIGSSSGLLQPFIQSCSSYQLKVLGINRSDWDLKDIAPSEELLGKICNFEPHHLVFAAGQNVLTDIHSDPSAVIYEMQEHMTVNCYAFVSIVLTLMKRLSKPLASIHALSSLYGKYGRRSRIPYCLSKHALEGAVKCLAIEFPQTQVLGYRPGFFETRLTRQNIPESTRSILEARIPLRRFGQPWEVSSLILANILSPSPYFTGHCLTVDGAMTAGGFFDQ